MLHGWQHIGGVWYYLDPDDGSMYSDGFTSIDGKIYGFRSSGAMYTGWYSESDGEGGHLWWYFKSSGEMAFGWQRIGNVWYYLDTGSGVMYSSCLVEIDGKDYYFLSSGAMFTGWHKETWSDGSYDWYYFKNSGEMAFGWQYIGGIWYYLEPGYGNMRTGWLQDGNTWYYLESSGAMATGWRNLNGTWYYFNKSGAMERNKWIGNYYVQDDGSMAVNQWIGQYFVGPDGKWIPLNAGETIMTVDNGDGTAYLVIGTLDTSMAADIFSQLNAYRAANGLYTLKQANSQLQEAVNLRSAECAVLFSHERPNGELCFSVYGNSCAENIAGGNLTASAAMSLWKNSAGHNANMLTTSATSVGIGVFRTRDGISYCVQLFSWD